MNGMCDRGLLPNAARFILLTSAIHIAPCILEENTPVSSSKITDILNTLKLAIFSLYVIYVLRLINVLKYFFEIENWQKCFGCISIGKQCCHHIHVPYAPDTHTHTHTNMCVCVRACVYAYIHSQMFNINI
jgi:hypothetical protein